MGSLCDQRGRWGPPAAVVGTGEAWTHSPTVWGRLMPAQTLWPVGGLPGMPFLPGGYFGQAGWSGETGVCRAASGAAVKGAPQRWRQASARVGVGGWRSVPSSPGAVGGGEATEGTLLGVTNHRGVPGTREGPLLFAHCLELSKGHSEWPLWSERLPHCLVTSESDPAQGHSVHPLPLHRPASHLRGGFPFLPGVSRSRAAGQLPTTAQRTPARQAHPSPLPVPHPTWRPPATAGGARHHHSLPCFSTLPPAWYSLSPLITSSTCKAQLQENCLASHPV